MRSIWKGSIGFGLVNIPVNLYSAVQRSELDLDMLDKKDLGKIHFKRVNENSGREVSWDNIVKAYDYDGKYIVLSDKDFASASPVKSRMIEIEGFVDIEEIDSIYYEQPYYLEPDKGGAKAYALLREALEKSGKVGLGSFVLRNKEHMVVLKVTGNVMVLNQIRFSEEVRDPADLDLPARSAVKQNELKMALSLINEMTTPFDIRRYKDDYTAQLMKLIKAKAKGKAPKVPKLKVVHKQKSDLMDQLKASLNRRKRVS